MAYAAYHQIGGPDGHLANLREFEGNSMSAFWVSGVYKIFSYSTCVASWDSMNGEFHYEAKMYSVTTSRQQTLIRAWTGRAIYGHSLYDPKTYPVIMHLPRYGYADTAVL